MRRVFPASVIALLVISLLLSCTKTPTQPASDTFKVLTLEGQVDPGKPVIDLAELGLTDDEIDAAKLEENGQRVVRRFNFVADQLLIQGDENGPVLETDRSYTLKLYAADNTRYRIDFTTSPMADISEKSYRQVVMVPAMPEQGFHWPYFLAIPPASRRNGNDTHKRYLMVDTTNTGASKSISEVAAKARDVVDRSSQPSMAIADSLWLPILYPAFPRPPVTYMAGGEQNEFYTHALDRDTARLHLTMQDETAAATLTKAFQDAGFDVKTLVNLDLQLNAMIDHAIAYLNRYGHSVVPNQVFLAGYSASGTFTDRYALLHPNRVKAIASGATLDDMVLPLAQYKGKDLIFPIGISDYQEIADRSFDLSRHNQVARLIFMGEDDTNNTLPYTDCYGETERQLITELWGEDVLPRAQALIKLYGESGGKGVFILDKGTKHGMSQEMFPYLREFFAANRDSDKPVYPIPAKPEQLKYTLFE